MCVQHNTRCGCVVPVHSLWFRTDVCPQHCDAGLRIAPREVSTATELKIILISKLYSTRIIFTINVSFVRVEKVLLLLSRSESKTTAP